MKKIDLTQIIKEEVELYFANNPDIKRTLEEEMIIQNDIILAELLDPNNGYEYKEEREKYYTYLDMNNIEFFVRLIYNDGYFELKTGWINDEGKPQYEPSAPMKSTTIDWDKRSNTVAKIFRDEILPAFEEQDLANILTIKPISTSRMLFAERMVKKFIDNNKFNVEYGSPIIITKKEKNETI